MVSRRILVEELPIQRVRQPRDRMPVALLHGCQCPCERVAGQAVSDVRVLGDVAVIIVIDEGMAVDWVVQGQRGDHQQETENDVALFWRGEQIGIFRS